MRYLFIPFVVGTLLNATLLASEITIAVAANVSYAMDTLKEKFSETHPDTTVHVILGSSGKLTAQIKNGAPYGLFMSANMQFPQTLYAENIAITAPVVYAQGALAYLSKTPKDFTQGITLLLDPAIEKIAIANPKTAPYGKAAVEAMTKAGIYDDVRSKLVFAESISQTVTYTLTAADIGLIAKSSLYSDKMTAYHEGIHWASVDPTLYSPIEQGIVLLKNAENNAEYRAFYDFMLSQQAKTILREYGYLVE
jgi:molybdate transport system substrate-binding protein